MYYSYPHFTVEETEAGILATAQCSLGAAMLKNGRLVLWDPKTPNLF
jgi:hypothetical protein